MVIKKIYELQNIGKGVIVELTEENLLELKKTTNLETLQEFLNRSSTIDEYSVINITDESVFGFMSYTGQRGGIIIGSLDSDSFISNLLLGYLNEYSNEVERGFSWFSDKTVFIDNEFSKGLEYKGDYESNFTLRSLITQQYLKSFNPQREIEESITLSALDHNTTIFINNSTPITITIPNSGLPPNFYVGFIHQTSYDVTYVGDSLINAEGKFKSAGVGYQQCIERMMNTSVYYLLGNTKT